MSGIKESRGHCPFSKPSPRRASNLVPYLRLSTWLTLFELPWRSPETGPTQLVDPPKLLFHMNSWSWFMLHNFLNPLRQATACNSEHSPYLLLSGPRPGTSSSQPRFTAWLHLGISKPSTSPATSDCFIAQARWPWQNTLGLHHVGNPKACAHSGQLQTMLEHHHDALHS